MISLIVTSSRCSSSQTAQETTASRAAEIPEQSSTSEVELPVLGTPTSARCCEWDGGKTKRGEDPIDKVLNGGLDGGLEDA